MTDISSSDADRISASIGVAESLRLVSLLHEGVFGAQPWTGFLRELRLTLGACYINIVLRRPGSSDEDVIEWADGESDIAADIRENYHRHAGGLDPIHYFQMEPGRVLGLDDLIGTDYRRHTYFLNFLKPNHLHHIFFMRVVEPLGVQAWLTVSRPADGKPFPRWTADFCELLAPHIAAALRYCADMEAARITRETRDRIMAKLNFGCVTIDASRHVIRHGQSVSQALHAGQPVSIDAAGKVRLASAIGDRTLTGLLGGIEAGTVRTPQVIILNAHERVDILVVPLPPFLLEINAAIATIYFQLSSELQSPSNGHGQQLRDLFGLSATEARLALCLATGQTIAHAARELSITVESARTFSKRIFAKTGTTRQADLVRLVLRSVVALA